MRLYYEDEAVTLYHGDCREALSSLSFDALVTDPPYGIQYQHGGRKGGRVYGMDGRSTIGDDAPFDPTPLLRFYDLPTCLWGANHYADRLPPARGWLVWDKRNGGPQMDQSDAELAWTNFLGVTRVWSRRWSGAHLGGREQRDGRCHPNQKPVALLHWCLGFLPDTTRVICDPYAGSGTLGIAAKEIGLRAILIEIDECYCETAAERCSQMVLKL